MNQLKQSISHLQTAFGIALFASLPMYFNAVTRWSMLLFIVFSLLDYVVNERYRQTTWSWAAKAPFCAGIALFLLLLLYLPFEANTQHFGLLAESRTALLVFGILGLLGTRVPKAKYLAYTAIAVSLVLIGYVLYLSNPFTLFELENWRAYIIGIRHKYIHCHMAFNTYLNAAIVACFYLMKKQKRKPTKSLYGLLIAFIYVCVGLSDGRIGFLGSNLIIGLGITYLMHHKYHKAMYAALVVFAVLGTALVASHPKVSAESLTDKNIRKHIWITSLNVYQEAPLLGVGASTNAANLVNAFIASDVISQEIPLIEACLHPDISGAHPHNQLLQSAMEFGIIGLLLAFVLLFAPLAYMVNNKSNPLLVALWLAILLQLQTEVIRASLSELGFCYYLLLTMYYAQQGSKKVASSV